MKIGALGNPQLLGNDLPNLPSPIGYNSHQRNAGWFVERLLSDQYSQHKRSNQRKPAIAMLLVIIGSKRQQRIAWVFNGNHFKFMSYLHRLLELLRL